jgi:hypothetical protein
MALVADTGALYALYDADDLHHAAVRQVEARALHATAGEREGISTYLNGSLYAGKWEPVHPGQDPPEVWTEGRNAHRKSILNANQSKRST